MGHWTKRSLHIGYGWYVLPSYRSEFHRKIKFNISKQIPMYRIDSIQNSENGITGS